MDVGTDSMIKASQLVASQLESEGVTTLFGLLGDGNIRFAVAAEALGFRFIAARHENAVVAMADGYARASGTVGVATVTTGPGLTNALTALTEAVRARTPLLVLAGATVSTAADYPQLVDQDAAAKALGAGIQRYRAPGLLAHDVREAFRRARSERRPIVLSIPVDDQDALVERVVLAPPAEPRPPAAAVSDIDQLVNLVTGAKRPVILAGWGSHLANARAELAELGRLTGAVLMTSANVKGFFDGEEFAGGTSGGFCSEHVAEVVGQADLVLAFGAGLNKWTLRDGTLYPAARIAQIDHDQTAFGKHFPVHLPIVADAREAAAELGARLRALGHSATGFRSRAVAEELELGRRGDPFDQVLGEDRLDPRTLTRAVDDLLPDRSLVVTDSGAFMGFPMGYLRGRGPGSVLFAQAFQSVGLGLATTSGAGLADPDRLPITMIGDGGTMMSLGDLETIVRLGVPHLVVVYNDSAYGAEIHVAGHHGFAADIVQFPEVDFAGIARSLGGKGVTVREVRELQALAEWLVRPDGLFLVDAKVSSAVMPPFMAEVFRAHVEPVDASNA